MSYESIARRWARAVFDLGKEGANLAVLTKDLSAAAELYTESTELRDVLDNPLVPEATREAILRDVAAKLGASEAASSTLRLLAKKRRLGALPDLARQLARLADDDRNVLRAEVRSAAPLSEAYLGKLKAELDKATGKNVTIATTVDPSLIGGVVTQIGDQVIDGSVRARLQGFQDALLRS